MPLNINRAGPTTPWQETLRGAFVATGAKTASTLIKNKYGVFGGILVTATDALGTAIVDIWNSNDAASTGDELLARVRITLATDGAQASFGGISGPGVEAEKGIWVQVVAGSVSWIGYYK